MQLTVGTSAVRFPSDQTPIVQNLGPNDLYFDSDPDVSTTSGLVLPAGSSYEFPRDLSLGSGALWMVSMGTSDIRYLVVG